MYMYMSLACIQPYQLSVHNRGKLVFRSNMNDKRCWGWSLVATRAQKFQGVNVTLSSTAIKQTNAAKGLP